MWLWNLNSHRARFYRWLKKKAKVREGEIVPKRLQIVRALLFPLSTLASAWLNQVYEFERDVWNFNGTRVTQECLDDILVYLDKRKKTEDGKY